MVDDVSNITHPNCGKQCVDAVTELKRGIIERGDLSYVSVDQQIDLVEQLATFPFGRFLIIHRGANAEWTDYLISGHLARGKNQNSAKCSYVEDFIFNRSLVVLAHRDRFKIYQEQAQSRLKDNVKLASVPCGKMRDLLDLDFSRVKNFRLIGIDYDDEALSLARGYAESKTFLSHLELFKADAWKLDIENEFDILTSSTRSKKERTKHK